MIWVVLGYAAVFVLGLAIGCVWGYTSAQLGG